MTWPVFCAVALRWLSHGRALSDQVGRDNRGAPRGALPAGIASREVRGANFGLRQSPDTVSAFAGTLLAIPVGRLSDRIGRHGLLVSGFVVLFIADLVWSIATNLWGVMVGVMFWCFAGVISWLIYHSLLGNKPEYSGELCRKDEPYQGDEGMPSAVKP